MKTFSKEEKMLIC